MKRHAGQRSAGALSYLIQGAAFSVALFCILSLIFGFIAYLCKDPTSLTGIFSSGALVLSFFGMGIFISLKRAEGGTALTLICSLIIIGVLLGVELIIKRGSVSVPFLINSACSMGAALIAPAIIGKRRRGHRRFK